MLGGDRTPVPARRRTRRRFASLALAAATVAGAVTAGLADAEPAAADVLLVDRTLDRTGPLGPITVIGDSVLVGSAYFGPTLDDQLLARGWGPVRIRAGVGYSTGYFATKTEVKADYWIRRWRDEGWDTEDIVVNLGANDSDVCAGDRQCAYDAIMHLVDAIGPGHRIWWPGITRHPVLEHHATAWNDALDRIAAERDDFFTWDWRTVMYAEQLYGGDWTHLTVPGYRRRSYLMSREITASLASATRSGDDAALPRPSGAPSELVPIDPPVRVIDTRSDPPGHVDADTAIEIDVSDHVPDGTTAIAAYVSATRTGADGFLTAYDCDDQRPIASSANYRQGRARGAVAITPVTPEGTFCLYTRADADLIVDLQAAFVPVGNGGDRLVPLAVPERLVDTRETGRARVLAVPAPEGATAVAVSLTAVRSTRPGYLAAYPCGAPTPEVATVNHLPGEVVSGAAFVPVGPDGTVCVFSLADAHVTVDLTGMFTADGELVFQPVPPTRMIDTRNGVGGWSPLHGTTQTIDSRVAPADAAAVSGTITIVDPMRASYLQAWSCGDVGDTANVTADVGEVLANSVTTGVDDDGRLCVLARNAGSTLFDVSGWWIPGPTESAGGSG